MTNLAHGKLFALLIGIDFYLPNRLPDGGSYPSLGGCVRDISHVESFLKGRLGLPQEQIIKLTSSKGEDSSLFEPENDWPTYENMVAAFKKLTERAETGDQLYIHYSGHGGRTVTAFPELKGAKGLDESLVPVDIGKPGTRYLRDIELSFLLKQMSDKGLIVTMVLDSCHSGGATRGTMGGAAVRGINSIDTTQRPFDSFVASHESLADAWQGLMREAGTRSAAVSNAWVPNSNKYVVLAACRANELANEFAFNGTERNGALTYWLLDTLQNIGPGLTYQTLHSRLYSKVHAKFSQQTPQLLGEGTREVFGSNLIQSKHDANIVEVDKNNNKVQLDVGKAQNVSKETQFAIYPATTNEFEDLSARLAIATVEDVKAASCLCSVKNNLKGELNVGDKAVLISRPMRLRGRVRLTYQESLKEIINQQAALENVEQLINAQSEEGWVRLVTDDLEAADFQVLVNANGDYEICDPVGKPLPNLRPALKVEDKKSAEKVIERLTHLVKFQNIRLIDNTDPNSALVKNLAVEWIKKEAADDDRPNNPQPKFAIGEPTLFDVGEEAFLHIKNDTGKTLNITVLDLQPDWGISKAYPPDSDYEPLDSGQELYLRTGAGLPDGYTFGTDLVKVFATLEATHFDWLLMEALDKPKEKRRSTRSAKSSMEELFDALTQDKPRKRQAIMSAPSRADWATKSLEMQIRRPTSSFGHTRDPKLSLFQAAMNEVITEDRAQRGVTRSVGGERGETDYGDELMMDVTRACLIAADEELLPNALQDIRTNPESKDSTRGAMDTVSLCSKKAMGAVTGLWDKWFKGDRSAFDANAAVLTQSFTDCDPMFAKALTKYVEYVVRGGKIPYRYYGSINDFVIDGVLKDDSRIGLVADWGTGQIEARQVLRQVKQLNPDIVMHLGDIYYAGTELEMETNFMSVWREELNLENEPIPTYTLAGNHDYYAGGKPYYDLIEKLGQPASYFCLRNANWQIISIDTALHDKLSPGSPPTSLEPTELAWLKDKVENNEGRRTVLLSHHQLFSTNEQFEGKSYNAQLYNQVSSLLPKVDLWLWGHEHDLVIFKPFLGLPRGRCIGGSAFRVGKFDMPETHKNTDVPYLEEIELSKGSIFYQHCYADIKFNARQATVSYYEDTDSGKLLYQETI